MSTGHPTQRLPAQQNPQSGFPYPTENSSRGMSFRNTPYLPPMSSLLSAPEPLEHQQRPPQYALHPRPLQPLQPQEQSHPLYRSEANPSAPVHHIYHPPQRNAYPPHYRAEPVLVPVQPANQFSPRPERVPIPPLAVPRQAKTIGQRRHEPAREYVEINRFSASEQGRFESDRLRTQSTAAPMKMEIARSRFESSTQRSPSPPSAPAAPAAIPDLLNGASSDLDRDESTYNLTVRQQPQAARACGFGERDRRVIDPPPILQLRIQDPTASDEEIKTRLRQLVFVVHVVLWDPVKDGDATAMPGTTDKRQQRRLMGTLVASPFYGKDEFDEEGCFFTFPDLSVRTPGKYSLRFSLVVVDIMHMTKGNSSPVRVAVKSAPFNVFNAKDFGGMRPSTELTKRLKHQGCLVPVKKGNSKSSVRDDDDDDDDDDDMGDDEVDMTKPPAAKRKKKT